MTSSTETASAPRRSKLEKFIRFGIAGLLLLGGLLFLNRYLVETCALSKPLAYLIVLTVQAVLGYGLNRYGVFEDKGANWRRVFVRYLVLMGGLRLLDLAVYSVLVELFFAPYLLTHVGNRILFFVVKFFLFQRVFETAAEISANEIDNYDEVSA